MGIGRWLERAGCALIDVVWPRACLVCDAPLVGTARVDLCGSCEGAVRAVGAEACPRCGKPRGAPGRPRRRCRACRGRRFAFRRAVVAVRYEGVARRAVHELKFLRKPLLARPMGEWLAQALLARRWEERVDVVVPVPLHRARRRERGYNQAEEIGVIVAEALGRPLVAGVLRRVRATARQARLPVRKRRASPAGAFRVEGTVTGRVLLIDDVLTTGGTADACARALMAAGAEEVLVAVVAG
ncbi:MAG: ComF family protein [Planctomycetota bacterium]